MNGSHLTKLALLAAISIAGAAWAVHAGAPTVAQDRRGEDVVPGLAARANDITGISVRSGADTFVITRHDNRFVAADSGYPVRIEAVRDVVGNSATLKFQEARTSDPARYGELGLADPGGEGGGKEITFRTTAGDFASLIVGNSDATAGGPEGGMFIRLKGQPRTFLVRGTVRLPPAGRSGWFAPVNFGVKRSEIKNVQLIGGGRDSVTLRPSTGRGGEFVLVDAPENRTPDNLKASLLPSLVDKFAFQDVREATAPAAPDARRLVVDGGDLHIIITSLGDLAEGWVHITTEATADAARERARLITAEVQGFDFRLPPNQAGNLGWTMADLSVEKKDEPGQGPD